MENEKQNLLDYMEDYEVLGSFNFILQLITINKRFADPFKRYLVTLHEYTHYLQSFTTTSGIVNLVDYISNNVLLLYAINLDNITPPFRKSSDEKAQALIKKIDSLIIRRRPPIEPIPYSSEGLNESRKLIRSSRILINNTDTHILFLPDGLNNQWYPVTRLALRENMSKMAEMSLVHYAKRETSYDITRLRPEYRIIYQYIKTLNIKDWPAYELCYLICEQSLMHPVPEMRALELLDALPNEIETNLPIQEAFKRFIHREGVIKQNGPLLDLLRNKVEESMALFLRFETENEFLRLMKNLFSVVLQSIEYRKQHISLYENNMDANWLSRMASTFGSPVLREPDDPMTTIGSDDSELPLNPQELSTIFANHLIQDLLSTRSRISICPFYKDYPICSLEKNEDICVSDPYKVLETEELKGCHLWNGLSALNPDAGA